MRVERTAIAKATPQTIWKTCFSHMKWEVWDPDLNGVTEVKGGCEDGTTFNFDMKSGKFIIIYIIFCYPFFFLFVLSLFVNN